MEPVHLWPETFGRWVLVLAGLLAWGLAALLAKDGHSETAIAFVTAGTAALLGGTFFSRVEEIGGGSVRLSRQKDEVEENVQRLPLPSEDHQVELSRRALEALLDPEVQESPDPPREAVRRAEMEKDRIAANMTSYVAAYLQGQGFRNVAQELSGQPDVRIDLVARKDGEVALAEIRPWHAIVREDTAATIAARTPAGLAPDEVPTRRILALQAGVMVMPEADQRLASAGIEVLRVDPDTGEILE